MDLENTPTRGSNQRLAGSIILTAIVLSSIGRAAAATCESLPAPSVQVKRQNAPVTLDTSYDHKSITTLGSRELHSRNRVLGLTRGTSRIGFQIDIRSVIDPTRQWECASPKISVTYGFDPMTIYVAKEFPKGSCAFNEIHQHELRHVQTYHNHLASIERDIAETLAKRFEIGKPFRGAVGQTRQMLEKELNERWIPYLRSEIERVESLQALIDTPEEYERVSRSCGDAIQRVIR